MKIINNNPRFGVEGPYEAESFEALADEMGPTFVAWAMEKYLNETGEMNDREYYNFVSGRTHKEIADKYCEEMRAEFIRGLEELTE